MDEDLQDLLSSLSRMGNEHDACTEDRWERMNNITPETGEFLAILVRATRARRVLEIGTSNGYSTLWLADAVRDFSGKVVTVEFMKAKLQLSAANFERAGLQKWIHQESGDAGEFLQHHPPESVDLLFLDSDRRQYVSWWPFLQKVLRTGGLLVVDNAVSHPEEMSDFVAQVRSAAGWRSVVVPVGKGEFMAIKLWTSS